MSKALLVATITISFAPCDRLGAGGLAVLWRRVRGVPMTTEDKVMYAIAGIVVLAVLVSVSWAVYVALAGSPLEAATEAALAATAEPTQPPQPTVSPFPVHTTQTPKPVEATPTPVPPILLPTHTPQPTAAPPTHTPAIQRTLYRVVEALAGDTVLVSMAGRTFVICYAGIDAPDPATVIGCMATQANRRSVKAKTVCLEKDTSETDQSGCLVRHVFLEDGTFVSAKLVYFGYTQVRTDSPDTRYRDLLLQAQQKAKEAQRGLWGSMPISAAVASLSVKATATPEPTEATLTPMPILTITPTPTPTEVPVVATPTPTMTATPTITPTPTPPETPTPSPSPEGECWHDGDFNCDGEVDLLDFELFRDIYVEHL